MFKSMTKIKTLILTLNGIEEMHSEQFATNENVVNLDIGWNHLKSLSPRIFKPLTKLESLNLSGNKIAQLPLNLFDSLSNLKELSMVEMGLTELKAQLFQPITKLEVLDANFNSIQEIDREIFHLLVNLKTLKLSWNSCTQLEIVDSFSVDSIEETMGECFKDPVPDEKEVDIQKDTTTSSVHTFYKSRIIQLLILIHFVKDIFIF